MGHKRRQQDKQRERNLVAKHARKYNLAHTFEDRKQAQKRGKRKHRGQSYEM